MGTFAILLALTSPGVAVAGSFDAKSGSRMEWKPEACSKPYGVFSTNARDRRNYEIDSYIYLLCLKQAGEDDLKAAAKAVNEKLEAEKREVEADLQVMER